MRYPAGVNVEPSEYRVGAIHDRRAIRTATDVIATAFPLAPEQLRLYVASCVSGPTAAVPEVALLPVQPPDAVHVETPVLDHVSVEEPPEAMFAGDALSATVGAVAAVTVTVVDRFAVPPAPTQVSAYVAFAVSGPVDCVPDVALLPDHEPLALQDVTLVLDQVSVDEPPDAMLDGAALSVTGWRRRRGDGDLDAAGDRIAASPAPERKGARRREWSDICGADRWPRSGPRARRGTSPHVGRRPIERGLTAGRNACGSRSERERGRRRNGCAGSEQQQTTDQPSAKHKRGHWRQHPGATTCAIVWMKSGPDCSLWH